MLETKLKFKEIDADHQPDYGLEVFLIVENVVTIGSRQDHYGKDVFIYTDGSLVRFKPTHYAIKPTKFKIIVKKICEI